MDSESDLLYALVACHHGDEKESGYITILHNEDFTIGWNCESKHKLFKIHRIATGVSLSYEDETSVERAR